MCCSLVYLENSNNQIMSDTRKSLYFTKLGFSEFFWKLIVHHNSRYNSQTKTFSADDFRSEWNRLLERAKMNQDADGLLFFFLIVSALSFSNLF